MSDLLVDIEEGRRLFGGTFATKAWAWCRDNAWQLLDEVEKLRLENERLTKARVALEDIASADQERLHTGPLVLQGIARAALEQIGDKR